LTENDWRRLQPIVRILATDDFQVLRNQGCTASSLQVAFTARSIDPLARGAMLLSKGLVGKIESAASEESKDACYFVTFDLQGGRSRNKTMVYSEKFKIDSVTLALPSVLLWIVVG
jgi:hypothetical protein